MSCPGGVPPCTRTLKPKHGSTDPAGRPLKPFPHPAQAQAPGSQLWTSGMGDTQVAGEEVGIILHNTEFRKVTSTPSGL